MIAAAVLTAWVSAQSGLNVRADPSLEAQIVAVLPFGTEVQGKYQGDWFEVSEGFLSAEWVSTKNPMKDWSYMGEWLTTAYTHTGSPCADGSYPSAGYSVATNSLPLGTEIYISGVGFRTVTDRGPASMPAEWLDIFMDSYSECVQWGEHRNDVWVIKTP